MGGSDWSASLFPARKTIVHYAVSVHCLEAPPPRPTHELLGVWDHSLGEWSLYFQHSLLAFGGPGWILDPSGRGLQGTSTLQSRFPSAGRVRLASAGQLLTVLSFCSADRSVYPQKGTVESAESEAVGSAELGISKGF